MTGGSPKMNINDQLRQSSKGRLNYERSWSASGKSKQDWLDEWTTPPKLSPIQKKYIISANIEQQIANARALSDNVRNTQDTEKLELTTSTPKVAIKADFDNDEDSELYSSCVDRRVVVLTDKERNDSLNLTTSPEYTRRELAVKDYEGHWNRKAKEAIENRREMFEANSRQLEEGQREGLIRLEIEEHKKWENVQQKTEDHYKEQNEEIHRRIQKLKDDHLHRKKFLDGVVKTVEGKKVQLEEEAKRQEEEVLKRKQTLLKIHGALRKTRDDLSHIYNSCAFKEYLPDPAKKLEELLSQLKNKADSIIHQASTTEASLDHVQKLHEVYQQAQNALDYLTNLVEEANRKGEDEKEKREQEKRQQQQQEQAKQQNVNNQQNQQTSAANTAAPTAVPATAPTTRGASLSEAQVAPEEAFEDYIRLQQNLASVEASFATLTNDPQMKKYKFDLVKAINTPLNAISPVGGEHLRDKLFRLCQLLGGLPVEMGSKRVSARDHPQGITFCKHLLTKMIVKKGDEQVTSKHESAFAIAMVTVGVWSEQPAVGDLLLGHFHAACPYIVPYYVPQLQGQTTQQHLQAQGYKFENGTVEKQDKFLKRMSGIMRLYAAIMVSTSPRTNRAHPHGIEHAWRWLTNMMNMVPQPDITATMIYDLLQVTGHALSQTYHRQFQKLLHHLLTDYLPKIQSTVLSAGPVTRLQNFLETCVRQNGHIPPPEGFLEKNFWLTR